MSCLQSCQMAKVLKKVKREKGESLMTNGIGKYCIDGGGKSTFAYNYSLLLDAVVC